MINHQDYFDAMIELGYESFSVESDGTVWTGTEDSKVFVDASLVASKVAEIQSRRLS